MLDPFKFNSITSVEVPFKVIVPSPLFFISTPFIVVVIKLIGRIFLFDEIAFTLLIVVLSIFNYGIS